MKNNVKNPVKLINNGAECTACGAVLKFKMPVDALVFANGLLDFDRLHKNCKPILLNKPAGRHEDV